MKINIIKSWEFSFNIIIFYFTYIYIIKIYIKNKTKLLLITNILYITIHTKLDFFSQHNINIYVIQNLLISYLIPTILNKFKIYNKIKIIKTVFIYNIKNYINYITILINLINTLPFILFYKMLNYRLYKFKIISELILYIIYWTLNINNYIYCNKFKYIIFILINIIINIIIGNYIYFNTKEIYNIYKICGEINDTKYIKLQQLKGLIKWLLNSMMLFLNIIIFKN